jgi:hypothetical protein
MKTMEKLSHDSSFPSLDLYPVPPEYETGVVPIVLQQLVAPLLALKKWV